MCYCFSWFGLCEVPDERHRLFGERWNAMRLDLVSLRFAITFMIHWKKKHKNNCVLQLPVLWKVVHTSPPTLLKNMLGLAKPGSTRKDELAATDQRAALRGDVCRRRRSLVSCLGVPASAHHEGQTRLLASSARRRAQTPRRSLSCSPTRPPTTVSSSTWFSTPCAAHSTSLTMSCTTRSAGISK